LCSRALGMRKPGEVGSSVRPPPPARRARRSCHYLRDPQLAGAVRRFLLRETAQIEYTLQVGGVLGRRRQGKGRGGHGSVAAACEQTRCVAVRPSASPVSGAVVRRSTWTAPCAPGTPPFALRTGRSGPRIPREPRCPAADTACVRPAPRCARRP
jgi:hypothetical protein